MTREEMAALQNYAGEHHVEVSMREAYAAVRDGRCRSIAEHFENCAGLQTYTRATAADVDKKLSERWKLVRRMEEQLDKHRHDWPESVRVDWERRISAHDAVIQKNIARAGEPLDESEVDRQMARMRAKGPFWT